MKKKIIAVFYLNGKTIERKKESFLKWCKNYSILKGNSKVLTETELVDIYWVDAEHRNIDKFFKRYPDVSYVIDINTDMIYERYPNSTPKGLNSLDWESCLIDFITECYPVEEFYYLDKKNETCNKVKVSKLKAKDLTYNYFKTKAEALNSVSQEISYILENIEIAERRYKERIINYNKEKEHLEKIYEILK